jgi:hypothetical protein
MCKKEGLNMKTQESTKKVIHNAIDELIIDLLETQTPFTLVVSSKNWDYELPDRLKNEQAFMIQIQEQSLIESNYDGKYITIRTQFDNIDNSLTLYPQDVHAILDIDMRTPILIKPFTEEPINVAFEKHISSNPLKNFTPEELTSGVKHSLDCFIKSNPEMFTVTTNDEV